MDGKLMGIEKAKEILKYLYEDLGLKEWVHPTTLKQSITKLTGSYDNSFHTRMINSMLTANILRYNGKTYTYGKFGYDLLGVEPNKELLDLENTAEVLNAKSDDEKV